MLRITLILVIGSLNNAFSQDFSYDGETGPEHWGETFNQCIGKHQSPINIDREHITKKILPKLQFLGFDTPAKEMNLTNAGHTVQLTVDNTSLPKITGGPLNGVYEFAQLHFHWGDNDTFGSEDMIEGRRFPMELHAVFYKTDYLTTKGAMDHEDGLAVLAFFFEIDTEDNQNYQEFVDNLADVQNPKAVAQFESIPTFFDLLGHDLMHYYTYNGSLTTPPCTEVVTWIDFREPILLSHDQLEWFRLLKNEHGQITHNFRPIQPLGDREIWFNVDISEMDNEIDLGKARTIEDELDTNELGDGAHKGAAAAIKSQNVFVVSVIFSLMLCAFVSS